MPSVEATGRQQVSLAAHRGWRDAAVGCAVVRACGRPRLGAPKAPRSGASEGRAMTAVDLARTRLARATARRATPKTHTARRTATASPRHDDSGAQSALEDASESVLSRAMITPADALPDDIGALHALI